MQCTQEHSFDNLEIGIINKAIELNEKPLDYLSKVSEIIKTLENYIYENCFISQNDIKEKVDELTRFVLLIPIPLQPGTYISRGVLYQEKNQSGCYDNPQRLSYNPNGSQKNRLNQEGESLFYGCLNADANAIGALLSEIHGEESQIYNLLASRVSMTNPQILLHVIPIGIFDCFRRGVNPPWHLHVDFHKIYMMLGNLLHPSARIAMQLCDAFFYKVLRQEVYADSQFQSRLYNVTIAVGEECLRHEMVDGIIYPSTKFADFPNIALKPKSVDTKLRYEEAISLKVLKNYGFGIYETIHLNQGIIEGNEIYWKNV